MRQAGFVEARVTRRQDWAEGLLTLRLDTTIESFEAGQFTNLGLYLDGELVRRSYSMASAPGEPLEFFLTRVQSGQLTPRLCSLEVGESLLVEAQAQGFFTLRWVPTARRLWLISSGTGLGPFISILRTDEPWSRFEELVVVHGVRQRDHLAYADELRAMSEAHQRRLRWVPVVSREPPPEAGVAGRVTTSLTSGALEERAGVAIDLDSHVMLCGNPQMIADMQTLLDARGLKKHRQRKPGHVTIEKYW